MRLAFVGDIALGDHPKTVGFGFRSRYANGIPSSLAPRLLPPGPAPDFLFGNLEFALGLPPEAEGLAGLQCRGLDAYAPFLATAGVGAVNLATNHTAQHGHDAFGETVRRIRDSGIHVAGTPADFTPAAIVRAGACRIAILAWNDRPRQYGTNEPPYNEFTPAAYQRITEARSRADLVVASIHWGDEFILLPSERERFIARAMIDAGASFVIGHHPHVLREVEHYRGGTIAYSLGNFVCDMTWDARTRVTGWLTAELEGTRVMSSELVPAVIDDDYFPRPLATGAPQRMWDQVEAARTRDREEIGRRGYALAAETERKRHAGRTGWMMLRNLHRYSPGVAFDVFRAPLASRFLAGRP